MIKSVTHEPISATNRDTVNFSNHSCAWPDICISETMFSGNANGDSVMTTVKRRANFAHPVGSSSVAVDSRLIVIAIMTSFNTPV